MLLAFFEVLVGDAPRGGVADERAVRFGTHYYSFKQLLWLNSLARRFAIADVAAARPELAEQARALLGNPIEPPDFFIVEPPNLHAVPRTMRAMWFRALAQLVAPGPYRELALRVAAAETYATLDTIAHEVLSAVETGFRDALGAEPLAVPDDAALRDRLLIASPRALFAAAG